MYIHISLSLSIYLYIYIYIYIYTQIRDILQALLSVTGPLREPKNNQDSSKRGAVETGCSDLYDVM